MRLDRLKYKSLCADAVLGGRRVLMKPQTFMNLERPGGDGGRAWFDKPLGAEKVYRDFRRHFLEPGSSIRCKGSDGGITGSKISYICRERTPSLIKMGVGKKPRPDYNLADWVLSRFTQQEQQAMEGQSGLPRLRS